MREMWGEEMNKDDFFIWLLIIALCISGLINTKLQNENFTLKKQIDNKTVTQCISQPSVISCGVTRIYPNNSDKVKMVVENVTK